MFKSARWRSEKNKIKAVFKLQFHATQVSQVGGDSLVMSLVPADIGKPTVRLEKAAIRDGSCFWENPVYETVKYFRDPKTGKIQEKIYNFAVSTGSSKAGLVGEVSIDFSSYAESIKLSSVSLPLKNAKSDAVLHVSIQRMQETIDQREAEEIENERSTFRDRSFKALLSIDDVDESIESNSNERIALSWMVQKETASLHCSGGILADDQGLGKTVSTIALILKERAPSSRACRDLVLRAISIYSLFGALVSSQST